MLNAQFKINQLAIHIASGGKNDPHPFYVVVNDYFVGAVQNFGFGSEADVIQGYLEKIEEEMVNAKVIKSRKETVLKWLIKVRPSVDVHIHSFINGETGECNHCAGNVDREGHRVDCAVHAVHRLLGEIDDVLGANAYQVAQEKSNDQAQSSDVKVYDANFWLYNAPGAKDNAPVASLSRQQLEQGLCYSMDCLDRVQSLMGKVSEMTEAWAYNKALPEA